MVLHWSNIEIPARLVFRPYRANWMSCAAEIVGWADKDRPHSGRSVDGVSVAPLTAPAAKTKAKPLDPEFAKWLAMDRVLVRISVPSTKTAEAAGILAALFAETYTVEIDRDNIPSEILQAHENPRTTPDIAGREFVVLACPRPEFADFIPQPEHGDVKKNPFAMRDEFFRLKNDVSDTRRFLDKWGLWNESAGYRVGALTGPPPLAVRILSGSHPFALQFPHQLWKQRESLGKALEGSARAWLKASGGLSLSSIKEMPFFMVERFSCESAIKATITIDHLRGAKFSRCGNCQTFFEHETLHKKTYCSRRCIQAAGVRRWRAKQKQLNTREAQRNAKG
jgi:hypothetical protein